MRINCPRCDNITDLGEDPYGLFHCDKCQIMLHVCYHCMTLDVPEMDASTRKLVNYIVKESDLLRRTKDLKDKCYRDYDHYPVYLILSKENNDELQRELVGERVGVCMGMRIAVALGVGKDFTVVV